VSFHFMAEAEKIIFLGAVFFETDQKGQFLGCYLRFPEREDIDNALIAEACSQTSELLLKTLQETEINKKYQGPLGIDAIFFENGDGSLKINPCIEINLKHTMGLLNIFIREKIHPEKDGKWKILRDSSSFDTMKSPQKQLKDGFIFDGSVLLTPPPSYKSEYEVELSSYSPSRLV